MTESDPRGGVEVTANAAVPEQAGSAAGSPDRRRWWRVLCRDVGHIRRYLTVLVNRDRVVLVGPPGRTVVLSTDGVGELSSALRRAAEQARK
ncbi:MULTISPECIES: hypothetical protein [Saccharopolyspora]|uniref:Uncharacterized protein n=1 Tax=Saccharopolyspora gregorii TaxID=33914 RepID=A0ABP6RZR0_9PSEU|nr:MULTISPECIES: hypothetical protein [unclassified Saccharopolyspora]MCA1186655.1 hypothetical protein [Saccharopolyspora sp. 6T]MCA1191781.1 hypothetical protein [Saccharopolyspora sp. 6V]MCA1227330.1 hypothetical protein [Saccharopolyspora sp. 6M]MCA1281168.1 hypothetical protein [Saccharopolyspora sp. 7B]